MNQLLTVECDLLKAVVTGNFTLEAAKMAFVELIDSAARHKSQKVLFDGREIIGNPQTMERFYYGSFVSNEVRRLHHWVLFAYVLLPPVLDRARFGETVAVNRGMAVRAFDNVEAALQWLGLERGEY